MKYYVYSFVILYILISFVSSEECKLEDNCRLVDINGDDEWINIPGHYRSIQKCLDDIEDGDTCLIRSGNYQEEISISEKNNIDIRGDVDYSLPVIDGTVELKPQENYDSDGDGIGDGKWKEESIDGNTVCVGNIDVMNDKHPFQLFLKDKKMEEHEMMTNARWPNALWSERDSETGAPLVFYNQFWGKSDETSTRGKMVDRKDSNGVSPLADSGLDMKGAMAVLNVGSFNTFVKPVKGHNAGDDYFTYEDDFGDIKFVPEHNQYYLDSSEALLDNPGEWYYNMKTSTLKFMPWSGSCPDPASNAVRGRVIDYGIDVSKTDGISISNIDFFASNIRAEAYSNHDIEMNEVYLDSLNFKYPSSSKRMLQDFNVPKITRVVGRSEGTISVQNCEFFGGEGPALFYWGKNAKIHNNFFKWNDWSGQMELTKNGGDGTVYGPNAQTGEEFIGNTLWYNGASAGLKPGKNPVVKNNLVVGQCDGLIMSDGAGIQIQSGSQPNCLVEGNWVFDSPKYGLRFDGATPEEGGAHGTMIRNVLSNTAGIRIKGDYHNISSNLALFHRIVDEASLCVVHVLRHDPIEHNANTIVESNAAWLADGGIDRISEDGGQWQLAGIKSNNYYGNHSWNGNDGYDGSWVLDGEVVIPEADLPDLVMDIDDDDFRPKPDTVFTSTGRLIGPYEPAYSDTQSYTIAGRKKYLPSNPIPSNERQVKMKDALIFQPAYRCNNEGDKHLVYIAPKDDEFPSEENPTAELQGDNNIVSFLRFDVLINPNIEYKWRVDCVQETIRRTGDVWYFTMK